MPSEILLQDGSTAKTDFYPKGIKAVQLYDSAVKSYFLKTFGRNQRDITCECERSNQPSIVQALHLSNGTTLNDKLAAKEGSLTTLLATVQEPRALVEEAYMKCLTRMPSAKELSSYEPLLQAANPAELRLAVEDLFWSLLTSREFLFQH